VFEEKKPVKEIIEEMRRELQEDRRDSNEPDPFEQLFCKKKVELATMEKKKRKKRPKKAKAKAQKKRKGKAKAAKKKKKR